MMKSVHRPMEGAQELPVHDLDLLSMSEVQICRIIKRLVELWPFSMALAPLYQEVHTPNQESCSFALVLRTDFILG